MYQGKPILRKIKQTNFNNPTLTSAGMRGVFYEPTSPQLVRDQLKYNANFKDSLQKTVQEEEKKRKISSSTSKPYYEQFVSNTNQLNQYQPLRMRQRNDMPGKVTQISIGPVANINYNGYQTIKTKQNHGFDIIKNF